MLFVNTSLKYMKSLLNKLSLKANPDYNISARYSASEEGSVALKLGPCPRKQYEAAQTRAHLLATRAQNQAIVNLGKNIGGSIQRLGKSALSLGKATWGVVKNIPSRINQARGKAHLLCGADKGTAVCYKHRDQTGKELNVGDDDVDNSRKSVDLLMEPKFKETTRGDLLKFRKSGPIEG